MRVTKLIREYVTETVNGVYNPRINAVGEEYRIEREQIEEKIDKIIAEANEKMTQILSENGYKTTYNSAKIALHGGIIHEEKNYRAEQERRILRSERDNKIKDILLNLELGATRAELDEMLKNI